jgi:hypothetical protein
MMKLFLLSLLVLAQVQCEVTADTDTVWVSSKYHNYGSHWMVGGGIIVFISCVLALGLAVEVWYKSKLTTWMAAQENFGGSSKTEY